MTESFACDICHVLCPVLRLVLLPSSLYDGYGQFSVNTHGHYGQRRDVCALWQALGGSWIMAKTSPPEAELCDYWQYVKEPYEAHSNAAAW